MTGVRSTRAGSGNRISGEHDRRRRRGAEAGGLPVSNGDRDPRHVIGRLTIAATMPGPDDLVRPRPTTSGTSSSAARRRPRRASRSRARPPPARSWPGTSSGRTASRPISATGIGIVVQSFASNNQLGPGNTVAFNERRRDRGANGRREPDRRQLDLLDNGGARHRPLQRRQQRPRGSRPHVGHDRQHRREPSRRPGPATTSSRSSRTTRARAPRAKTFVGFVTVQDGAFNEELPVTLPERRLSSPRPSPDAVTNDTSEFSNCIEVGGGGGARRPTRRR